MNWEGAGMVQGHHVPFRGLNCVILLERCYMQSPSCKRHEKNKNASPAFILTDEVLNKHFSPYNIYKHPSKHIYSWRIDNALHPHGFSTSSPLLAAFIRWGTLSSPGSCPWRTGMHVMFTPHKVCSWYSETILGGGNRLRAVCF